MDEDLKGEKMHAMFLDKQKMFQKNRGNTLKV
jgi:hypothetical protein